MSGTSIFIYTTHGGTINGMVATTLTLGETGAIEFIFKAGSYNGNIP